MSEPVRQLQARRLAVMRTSTHDFVAGKCTAPAGDVSSRHMRRLGEKPRTGPKHASRSTRALSGARHRRDNAGQAHAECSSKRRTPPTTKRPTRAGSFGMPRAPVQPEEGWQV
jgi:hypothetical protein